GPSTYRIDDLNPREQRDTAPAATAAPRGRRRGISPARSYAPPPRSPAQRAGTRRRETDMDQAPPLAMLAAPDGLHGTDRHPHDAEAGYFDWSTRIEGGRQFEIGCDGDVVTIQMTWQQIARLQQALTVLLLEHDGE